MMRHGRTMDSETERARLAKIYSDLSDEGLAELAADEKSLSDVAREVLEAELATRGMEIRKKAEERKQHSGPLVMVKRFRDLPEAFVAKSILDSAQIDSFLADQNLVRMDWLYSNLIGGMKLMVRPEDFEEAKKLLDEQANEANAAEIDNLSNPSGDGSE